MQFATFWTVCKRTCPLVTERADDVYFQVEAEMDRHDPCYDPVEDQRDIVVQRFVEDPFPALGGEIRLVAQEEADAMSPKGHTAVNLCD